MNKQEEFVSQAINEGITNFTEQRKRMFKKVKRYKLTTIGLAAASTIVLGLNLGEGYDLISKNIALVIGAVLTLITTLATFWNIEEYWLQNKVIEHQLISLREKFDYLKRKKTELSEEETKRFFDEYQKIIEQFHIYWQGVLEEIKETDEGKK